MDPKRQAILDALTVEGQKYDDFLAATDILSSAKAQLALAENAVNTATSDVASTKAEAEAAREALITAINDAFKTS